MAIDTNVQTFTDTEMLNLVRLAIVNCTLNQSYTVGNRTFTRADLAELRETELGLKAAIDGAAATNRFSLISFGRPV